MRPVTWRSSGEGCLLEPLASPGQGGRLSSRSVLDFVARFVNSELGGSRSDDFRWLNDARIFKGRLWLSPDRSLIQKRVFFFFFCTTYIYFYIYDGDHLDAILNAVLNSVTLKLGWKVAFTWKNDKLEQGLRSQRRLLSNTRENSLFIYVHF